jgi:hypothetical protein
MNLEIEERHIKWAVVLQVRNDLDDVLSIMRRAHININLKDRTNGLIQKVDEVMWITVNGHRVPKT